MENLLLLLLATLICIILYVAPMTEITGLFFLLSSFAVTKWFNNINNLLIINIMWLVFVIYILVLAFRFKINLIKCFANIPRKYGIYLILLVFGVYCLIGTIYSIAPVDTVKRSLGYIVADYFFLLFLPELFRKTNDLNIKRLFLYLNLSFLIPIVAGLFLLYTNSSEVTYMQGPFQRFTGIYGTARVGLPGNPNAVGYASFLLGSISIIGYVINRRKYLKLFCLGTFICSLLSISASACRSALVVLLMVLILMSALRIRKVMVFIAPVVVLLVFLWSFGTIGRIIMQGEESIIVQRLFLENTSNRTEIWKNGIMSLHGLQFLVGYGLGSVSKIKRTGSSMGKMMNIYIEIFIESGLIGITLFLTFLSSGFVIIFKRWRFSGPSEKTFLAGITAFYCGLCAYGFPESILTPSNPVFHFLLFCVFLSIYLPQPNYGFTDTGKRIFPVKRLRTGKNRSEYSS